MNKKESLKKQVRKNAFILSVFALISTLLVSIVHQFTKDKIASEVQRVMNQQLNSLVNSDLYDNSPISDCLQIKSHSRKKQNSIKQIYRMRQGLQPIAMIIASTAHDGYSGDINLLIAISNQDRLIGLEVVNHTETPGLGDKIESNKSNWLQQFKNINLAELNKSDWRVKKDGGQFDALTGATITPRAVINSLSETIDYFLKNKQNLFTMQTNCVKSN